MPSSITIVARRITPNPGWDEDYVGGRDWGAPEVALDLVYNDRSNQGFSDWLLMDLRMAKSFHQALGAVLAKEAHATRDV